MHPSVGRRSVVASLLNTGNYQQSTNLQLSATRGPYCLVASYSCGYNPRFNLSKTVVGYRVVGVHRASLGCIWNFRFAKVAFYSVQFRSSS